MVRLLDASLELNNWAAALNMFTLWMVSAGVAVLLFAVCARRTQLALIAQGRSSDPKPLWPHHGSYSV
jgi:hypothetical protein